MYNTLKIIYKLKNNILPKYLRNSTMNSANVHNYLTGSCRDLRVPKTKLTCTQIMYFKKAINFLIASQKPQRKPQDLWEKWIWKICDYARKSTSFFYLYVFHLNLIFHMERINIHSLSSYTYILILFSYLFKFASCVFFYDVFSYWICENLLHTLN